MVTGRSGRHPILCATLSMACYQAHHTFSFPFLDITFLSIIYISSAIALSLDPTSRYVREMRRLLGDTHSIIQVPVASPLTDSSTLETEANSAWIEKFGTQEVNGWSRCQNQPSDQMIDIPTPATFDESNIGPGRYEPPPPLQDPYYDWIDPDIPDESSHPQPHGKEPYYQSQQLGSIDELNGPLVNHQTNEPNYRPQRFTDLFDAVNDKISALGNQIQKSSTSLRSVIDTTFSQPESDREHENQEVNFHVDPDYQQSRLEFYKTEQSESVSGDEYDSSDEHDPYYNADIYSQPNNGQQYNQIPDFTSGHQNRQLELENNTIELNRSTMSSNAAEDLSQEQENGHIKREQLEQAYLNRLRAVIARDKSMKQEKNAFGREADERLNTRQPVSIIKSREIFQLPDTNDPLELLGLNHRNPPQTVNDIRRAFLRMAKKYHPDAITADASPEEREKASRNFARINSAYQLLKEKQERLGEDYFATMLGGPMYEPRNSHIRQSFSRGYGYDDYSSIFSGNTYSARYGPKYGGQTRPLNGNNRNFTYGATMSPFRRNRQDVGDNCHVSGEEFPPFFNN